MELLQPLLLPPETQLLLPQPPLPPAAYLVPETTVYG